MKVQFLLKNTGMFERLGIMTLSSILKKNNHEVNLILTEELDENYDEIMNSLFTFFGIKNIELTKVKRKNVGIEKVLHEPMKEKIREFLIDFYKPHNDRLFRMIHKEFEW